jgi:hypothetical protein
MSTQLIFKTPSVPVSWGELIDKITILEIKEQSITNPIAVDNVKNELHKLNDIAAPVLALAPEVRQLKDALVCINQELWNVEDELRLIEETQQFHEHFIQLARSVYRLNDQRARLKKEINKHLSSELTEEKSYKGFAHSNSQ